MKLRNLLITALCALAVSAGFTSCTEDENNSWKDGSKVDLPQYRAFILSEGTMSLNNSHLFFVNPQTDEPYETDIFEKQNGIKLGDTANDMVTYNGNIYIIVNVSKVMYKLNGSGVKLASYAFDETLGEPRNIVAYNGKIYVTCYGGYVARFDANSLAYESKVATDPNPEQIVVYNNKLYCVNSGYGEGHTMSVISIYPFETIESVEIPTNPFGLQKGNDALYIQSYRTDWTVMVSRFNPQTNTYTEIATATRMMADGDKLYLANSTSADWVNYTTTLSVYDEKTKITDAWNLTGTGANAITNGNVYMIEKNPYDGSFYVATTDYYSNSPVYHFSSDGSFISTFSAGGINANSMVFMQ